MSNVVLDIKSQSFSIPAPVAKRTATRLTTTVTSRTSGKRLIGVTMEQAQKRRRHDHTVAAVPLLVPADQASGTGSPVVESMAPSVTIASPVAPIAASLPDAPSATTAPLVIAAVSLPVAPSTTTTSAVIAADAALSMVTARSAISVAAPAMVVTAPTVVELSNVSGAASRLTQQAMPFLENPYLLCALLDPATNAQTQTLLWHLVHEQEKHERWHRLLERQSQQCKQLSIIQITQMRDLLVLHRHEQEHIGRPASLHPPLSIPNPIQ